MSDQDLKFVEWQKSLEESGVAVYRNGNGTQGDWIITLQVHLTYGEQIDQISIVFPPHSLKRLEKLLPAEHNKAEIMSAVTKYIKQKYNNRLEYGDEATPQDFVHKYIDYHLIVTKDLP